jgi:thioesterase domain-containing protein/aryl carrier-like protein
LCQDAAADRHGSGAPSAYATAYLHLEQEQSRRLQTFAASRKVTLNTLVQAAWTLLLHEYTGADDIAFGVTVSGRSVDFPGIERVMGMCINTLPLIQHLDRQQSVGQWLAQLQAHNLSLRQREHVALGDVMRWSGQPQRALFDTLIIFENFPVDESLKKGVGRSLAFDSIRSRGATDFPLTLVVLPGAALRFQFEYDGARLSAELVEQLTQRLATHLAQLMEQGDGRLAGLLQAVVTPPLPAPAVTTAALAGVPTGFIETALAGIWQDVLGLSRIARHDDFFALGGNSLQAMRLMSRWNTLAREQGVAALQPADLFALPVLQELAQMLASRGEVSASILQRHSASRPLCVTDNEHANDAPVLICFPARMSNRDEYSALATALGAQHTVLQLLCPPHEQWRWSSMDVTAMATHYAAAIRHELQGRRCVFIGWSVGGLLALETARQLQDDAVAAITIDWIGLADSSDFAVLRGQLAQLQMPPATALVAAEQRLDQWLQRSLRAAGWHALLAQMTPAQRAYFLLEIVTRMGENLPLDVAGQEGAEAALWERIRCLRLGLEWQGALPTTLPLHVWQAGQREAGQLPTDWSSHAPSDMPASLSVVAGSNHLSLLAAPQWHALVAQLLR